MQRVIKRIFDFLFSLVGLIVSSPILLVAVIIIHIKSPEDSALFKQQRVGYKGKVFTILKLRTMTNEKDENGELLPDELRLKKWGIVIRKMNIDELPQLINILRGQMSLIGPRPILPKEMFVMTEEEQKLRQSVTPGITGWEAINEEKTDSREEMAKYDLYYVRHWSLWFDIKIFFTTIFIVLTGKRSDDAHRAPKIDETEIKTENLYCEE